MNQTLSSFVGGAAGALLVAAVVVAQPALADQVDKTVAKNQVTSKSIKNGTIQGKDLNAALNASLAKADSALQSVPDNSITNPKMADNAVSSAEVAANSLVADDLAPNSVGASELANDSVNGGAVVDGTLNAVDIFAVRGVTNLNFASIPAGSCLTLPIDTGNNLNDDLILLTAGSTMPGIISTTGRQQAADSQNIAVVACNAAGAALDPGPTDFAWGISEN